MFIYYNDGDTSQWVTASIPYGNNSLVGSINKQILYNASGSAAGATGFIYDAANNRVGIGTLTPAYTLEVNGSFAATTKSFIINHPTKPEMKLRHGSLEGPENGVYVRGRGNSNVINLPEYWSKLVDPTSITVNITPIDLFQSIIVTEYNNKFIILNGVQGEYFYIVYAERIDVEDLQVEI